MSSSWLERYSGSIQLPSHIQEFYLINEVAEYITQLSNIHRRPDSCGASWLSPPKLEPRQPARSFQLRAPGWALSETLCNNHWKPVFFSVGCQNFRSDSGKTYLPFHNTDFNTRAILAFFTKIFNIDRGFLSYGTHLLVLPLP